MTPTAAAGRFGVACLLGAGLGLLYGFLRPLRPRRTTLADGLFLLAAAWSWLYLTFGLCGGDAGVGCTMGLAVGAVAWEAGPGRLLRPLTAGFWKGMAGFLRPVKNFLKKSRKTGKFLLAIVKKWGTIR